MEKFLLDSSAHLGQFSLDNESIRIGCKNIHVLLTQPSSVDRAGVWTDFENGRVDRTVWSIDQNVQSAYYPYMDHFFSVANIEQPQIDHEVESLALGMRAELPHLSLYGRINLATAVIQGRTIIYTLFSELLDPKAREQIKVRHNLRILRPEAEVEKPYPDPVLEQAYQKALSVLREECTDLLRSRVDQRQVE